MPTTVQACHTGMVWAVPRSLAATEGISLDVCSSGYLDGSVPPVSPHGPFTDRDVERLTALRVTPFGHPRISGCLLLLVAFRSLPRPSSPSSSKASTVDPCPLAISPIYPSLCPTTAVKTPSSSGDVGGAPAFEASTPLSKIRRPKDAQACTAQASVIIVSISSAAAGDTSSVCANVEVWGLEPQTYGLQSHRSGHLSYTPGDRCRPAGVGDLPRVRQTGPRSAPAAAATAIRSASVTTKRE